MKVRSYQDIGHDFLVPESFSATMLPEWRLASFSLVLPIPEAASLTADGKPFDLGAHGWAYGRDKGLRTIENPMWDHSRGVFRKPDEREGYYGDIIVEGGRPYYNDARNRFLEPMHDAVGAGSVDADVKRTVDNRPHANREVFDHSELENVVGENRRRRQANAPVTEEKDLADTGWDPAIAAHHFAFDEVPNETAFELVNYDHQVAWEDQVRGTRGSHGTATLRLMSAEVLQFHDLHLTNLAAKVPEPAHVVSEFLVLNVVAENLSSATLGFLSAALTKPRNSVQFYDRAGDYDYSPPQLFALTKFVNIAVREIDSALGRETSMKLSTSGGLVATCEGECSSTFTLPAPQRVAMAIPNPAKPKSVLETLSEGNNGSVPSRIDAPLVLDDPDSTWKWHEQWAWQILTGADSYPEQVPLQTPEALSGFVAAKLSSWTVMTSESGVGLVRSKSASREGMRYWSLANTRFVDLVMLQMRAQAGETHLRKSLKIIGDSAAHTSRADGAAGTEQVQRQALQSDLERLEKLQLDHIEIRDKLWFRRVPDRDIDTRVLKGLQRATGFDQLRDDFDTKVKSRQGVIRTQFEQVSGEIAEAEAKRSEAMNLILGFVAAAIGAPDWAQAAGWEGLWGNLGMGLIIFVLMFALVWALQAVFRKATKQGRHLRFVEE